MSKRLESLLELLQKDSNDSFLIYGIALEYMAQKDYKKAEEFFKKLLKYDPKYVAGYMQYAQLKAEQNEIQQARELYQKGITAAIDAGDNRSAKEMEEFLDEL